MRELKLSLLAAFLFSLLFSCNSFSQDKTTDYNPLAENKYSAIFEIGTFLNGWAGNTYKSFTLSGKYHFNEKNGLRLSISTNGNTESRSLSNGLLPDENYTAYDEKFNIESDIHWIHYLNTRAAIKIFVGIGPHFEFIHQMQYNRNSMGIVNYSARQNTFGVGLSGVFGLEYFILDNISVLGEYYCLGYYKESVDTDRGSSNSTGERKYFSHGWEYNISRMRLGFSVYF
ncbi:MAG: hypothetical protein LWX07_10770 [Bacteroidetes bacterium]|nr:hypothetical protein [Bacteroidota bacterium]